jgi:hypothetical protein
MVEVGTVPEAVEASFADASGDNAGIGMPPIEMFEW